MAVSTVVAVAVLANALVSRLEGASLVAFGAGYWVVSAFL